MSKILITGGTGYIGSALAAYLSKQGMQVFITSHNRFCHQNNVRTMDLLDERSIDGVCKGIDAVIHTAAYGYRSTSNSREILLANGYGTKMLLEDAKKHGVKKFIYLSTYHVYGRSEGCIDENTLVNPISDYALTHYVGEMYCKQYSSNDDLLPIIVRITNGYGMPYNNSAEPWSLVVNQLCKTSIDNGFIQINSQGTQLRDFIAIDDISRAIELILTSVNESHASLFNISSEASLSINELAEIVAHRYFNIFQKKLPMKHVYNTAVNYYDDEVKLFVSSCRLRALGWNTQCKIENEIDNMLIRLKER